MSSSKLDYLKKYMSGSASKGASSSSDKKHKKKHRKKRRRGDSEKSSERSRGKGRGMMLVDEDDDWRAYAPKRTEDQEWAAAAGGEDAPVVLDAKVVEAVTKAKEKKVSTWETVGDKGSASPSPPRRQRVGSVSSDESVPRRRQRVGSDSDSDAAPPRRRQRLDTPSPTARRQRLDSDSDASVPRRGRTSGGGAGGGAGAGSDSDMSVPRRKRVDSSDSDASVPRRRKRAGSDSDASAPRRRKRAGSDSDASVPRRRQRADSDASGDEGGTNKMSSGATAGLHSAKTFAREQKELKKREMAKLTAANADDLGRNAKTVFRKDGKVVDKHAEAAAKRREIADKARQRAEWNVGTVQKRKAEADREAVVKAAAAPFARHKNDKELDQHYRSIQRAGDPMAAIVAAKKGPKSTVARTLMPPCPNRFNIRPGYRWDGAVRGIKFEDRLLAHRAGAAYRKEAQYKWSVSDM